MGEQLSNVYLDNEPCLFDAERQVFLSVNFQVLLTMDEAALKGKHVANLEVVVIKGYPCYHDERLKEFRRVGEPTFVLDYEQFDLLPEEDRKVFIPRGDAFKKVMAKERRYWTRQQKRDADSDRGGG